ncbi:MAG: DUF3267 domain-containing protein [Caldilineaceae bacterium]
MQAVKTLPAHYAETDAINLAENKRLAFSLSIVGFLLFFFFALLFTVLAAVLRYNVAGDELELRITGSNIGETLVVVACLVALTVIIHELIHALFFRIFTGEWARFNVKGLYAYAAAPDWYLPRNLHVAIALAPLVLISVVGMVLILLVPLALLWGVLLCLVVNAAGAIGDIAIAGWLLTKPSNAYVNDYGDGFAVYTTQRGVVR